MGRACQLVVATLLVARPAGDPETYVARALSVQRVPDHLLPSAVDWVLRADALVRQRGWSVVFVEQSIRTGIAGIQLSGSLDLVISGGSAAPLELVDWTFGRNPRFASVETMALNLGTSNYRTLPAVAMPERPDHVLVSDVHVPGRQALSVELDRGRYTAAMLGGVVPMTQNRTLQGASIPQLVAGHRAADSEDAPVDADDIVEV